MKKIIFFENIRWIHLPVVWYHLWRGYEIRVFDFNYNLKRSRWLRRLINSGKITRLYIHPYNKEHGDAVEQTEQIFKNLKDEAAVRLVASLYGSDETDAIFKKSLVKEIFKVIYMNRKLAEELRQAPAGTPLYFVPEQYGYTLNLVQRYGTLPMDTLPGIGSPGGTKLIASIIHASEKLKCLLASLLVICSTALSILRARLLGGCRQTARFHAVVVLNHASQVKFRAVKDLELFVEGKDPHQQGVLFLLKVPKDCGLARSLAESDYPFLRHNEIDERARFPFNSLKTFFQILFRWGAPVAFLRTFFVALRTFLGWHTLLRHLSFSNYIYANEEGPDQIALNILLRKEGRASWSYPIFLGGAFTHSSRSDFHGYENSLWSFLNPDYLLVVNQDAANYYKLHRQTARNYIPIGSLFSEMICQKQNNLHRTDTISRLFGREATNGARIVSFYDTSFIDADNCPSNFEDGIAFYEDILKLLDSSEDLLAIIKPAKGESWFVSPDSQWSSLQRGSRMIGLWKKLQSHPRVCWAGHQADSASVIAASDLVVTHCMSSPTSEALGARKKAIWYESCEKHRGTNRYANIPGLVSHGYPELQENVDRLLYRSTDEEYSEYLERYIKGTVDPYLDGQAFTRFRNLFRSTNPA